MRVRHVRALDYPSAVIYAFDRFELDTGTGELRSAGEVVSLEPQVYALLLLLIQNRERLVSKDEIVEHVWDGRPVSDSAISSRVKSARQALGDDGRAQRFVRTLHRRGFRFVAEARIAISASRLSAAATLAQSAPVETSHAAAIREGAARPDDRAAAPDAAGSPGSRPSIAVLPFGMLGAPSAGLDLLGEALAHDLIVDLSRLHWLLVTARGSSFRFRLPHADVATAARALGVRYVLHGSVEIRGRDMVVTAQLTDARDDGLVWAERFDGRVDEVHAIRHSIREKALVELDLRIPLHEATLARLVMPDQLDAWSAYHLGLQHTFRFNRADNAVAHALFTRAVQLEPGFARAHAGLSFVHFQTAFLRHTDDVDAEARAARRAAERGLELDPLDPFVNFTMGRSFWLEGDLDASLGWLERATRVSPSYAQGIYARAWTETLSGLDRDARRHVDAAMQLSPFDPLHYAMMGTRALLHVAGGETQEAVWWAQRAARAPGAHPLIAMIAAIAEHAHGDTRRAAAWAAEARARNPRLTASDFFRAFPIRSAALRERAERGLLSLGFASARQR